MAIVRKLTIVSQTKVTNAKKRQLSRVKVAIVRKSDNCHKSSRNCQTKSGNCHKISVTFR